MELQIPDDGGVWRQHLDLAHEIHSERTVVKVLSTKVCDWLVLCIKVCDWLVLSAKVCDW